MPQRRLVKGIKVRGRGNGDGWKGFNSGMAKLWNGIYLAQNSILLTHNQRIFSVLGQQKLPPKRVRLWVSSTRLIRAYLSGASPNPPFLHLLSLSILAATGQKICSRARGRQGWPLARDGWPDSNDVIISRPKHAVSSSSAGSKPDQPPPAQDTPKGSGPSTQRACAKHRPCYPAGPKSPPAQHPGTAE